MSPFLLSAALVLLSPGEMVPVDRGPIIGPNVISEAEVSGRINGVLVPGFESQRGPFVLLSITPGASPNPEGRLTVVCEPRPDNPDLLQECFGQVGDLIIVRGELDWLDPGNAMIIVPREVQNLGRAHY